MNIFKSIISAIFIAAFFCSCSDLDKVASSPKSVKKADGVVYAEGRWMQLPEAKIKFIAKINSVSITCNSVNMTCEEIQSFIYTPKNEPQLDKYLLYNLKTIYTIYYWVNDVIKARKYPVADIEITVSSADNFAEKIYCEKNCGQREPSPTAVFNRLVLE